MNKLFKGSVVLGAAVLSFAALGGTATVFAADGDTTPADTSTTSTASQSKTTNGKITLNVGKDDQGNDQTITLDDAPDIDFGTHDLDALTDHTYPAETKDAAATTLSALQVTNPGFASGWNVTVAATPFTDGNHTLKGTTLTLGKGTAEGPSSSSATANESMDLNDQGQVVFSAAETEGVGTWKNNIDKATTTLKVPAGNTAGNYSADLTWELTNAPKN